MKLHYTLIAVAAAAAFGAMPAGAVTLKVANQGDSLSMDPHSLNESLQLSVTGNVYEPLVGRGKDLALAPRQTLDQAKLSELSELAGHRNIAVTSMVRA